MLDDRRHRQDRMRNGRHVAGWDVGGVNTKVAHVEDARLVSVCGRPFELQRAPEQLVPLLRDLAREAGCPLEDGAVLHAVTMTAELSQMFRTKREGVAFVLDAFETAFPSSEIQVFATDGRFLTPVDARANPLAVGAANWSATAHLVAIDHPDALLIDIGTTTTDIIPVAGGVVVARGRTDPERLASGELVYTGSLRTPAEAIASEIEMRGETIGVSAEGFALAGDAHLWRGDLAPADYTVPTPDGRPAEKEFAGERLARVICADREMLDEDGISAIADALARAQVSRIAAAIRRVAARHPSLDTAVVTGLGAFLADAAARAAGLKVVALASELGATAARFAPAAAVALLLDRTRAASPEPRAASPESRAPSPEPRVDLVVKIGGGLLAQGGSLDRVLSIVSSAARDRRLLVVPGGGPFADAVRAIDARVHLSDATAHWMALLAMDQYAHLIAERLPCSTLVTNVRDAERALNGGHVPVLAPSQWLREADPLPLSWDVTSDSIAAWIAGRVRARRVVLVKPAGASNAADVADAYFARALTAGVEAVSVAAWQLDALRASLCGFDPPPGEP
jgi:(4-(4-[2-(gamma-L-glutamylamino)ethyl]phenoxymethyl)furan-2-yl)methanamine synthase